MCWDDSEVQWAGDGLQNAYEAETRRQRTWLNGRQGTEVPDHEDSSIDKYGVITSLFKLL